MTKRIKISGEDLIKLMGELGKKRAEPTYTQESIILMEKVLKIFSGMSSLTKISQLKDLLREETLTQF